MDETIFYREGDGFKAIFTGSLDYPDLLASAPDTVFFPIDDASVQLWLLDKEKSAARLAVAAAAEKYRARISGDATQRKMASWPVWKQIALDIKAGNGSPSDIFAFQVEIRARGKDETLDQFCDAVLRDASRYQVATALINGLEHSTKSAIDNVTIPGSTAILLMNAAQMAEIEFTKLLSGTI